MQVSDKEDSPKGRVLVVAGSDSGGGAGIQADIKTITVLGGYAATAVTALTVQNTMGVSGVIPAPPRAVCAQAEAVLQDIGADVIKTGMLGDKALITQLAQTLSDLAAGLPRVIDPVMVATSGDRLLPVEAVEALKSELVRYAILTPNSLEAEILTGKEVADINGQRRAAERLLEDGAEAAIVKGGHVENGDVITDLLATPDGEVFIEHPRLDSPNTHGTGCTLASAIACGLARGLYLETALRRAITYVSEAIRTAPGLGAGAGPINHGWVVQAPEIAAQMLTQRPK